MPWSNLLKPILVHLLHIYKYTIVWWTCWSISQMQRQIRFNLYLNVSNTKYWTFDVAADFVVVYEWKMSLSGFFVWMDKRFFYYWVYQKKTYRVHKMNGEQNLISACLSHLKMYSFYQFCVHQFQKKKFELLRLNYVLNNSMFKKIYLYLDRTLYDVRIHVTCELFRCAGFALSFIIIQVKFKSASKFYYRCWAFNLMKFEQNMIT